MNKYIATFGMSAFDGIGIVSINDEYCITEYCYNDKTSRAKNKIYYDNAGNAYIKKYGCRYNLNDFIRN